MVTVIGDPVQNKQKTIGGRQQLKAWLSRISLLMVLVFLMVGIVQLPAHGYVLRGSHLLSLVTQALGRAKNLAVHQTLIVYDNAVPGALEEISETLTYRFSNAFRSDSTSTTGVHRIHVDTLDDNVTIYDGAISSGEDPLYDSYKDLLLFRSRTLLQERMAGFGVDPTVTSLGRFEGKPVFVIGAQYPDELRSQVWIEKETFRPLRWLIPQTDVEDSFRLFEFRYSQWEQFEGIWYPMNLQCFQDGRLIREIMVNRLELAALDLKDQFDTHYLRMRYAPGPGIQGEDPLRDSLDSDQEIQQVIDDFKKRYEQ